MPSSLELNPHESSNHAVAVLIITRPAMREIHPGGLRRPIHGHRVVQQAAAVARGVEEEMPGKNYLFTVVRQVGPILSNDSN